MVTTLVMPEIRAAAATSHWAAVTSTMLLGGVAGILGASRRSVPASCSWAICPSRLLSASSAPKWCSTSSFSGPAICDCSDRTSWEIESRRFLRARKSLPVAPTLPNSDWYASSGRHWMAIGLPLPHADVPYVACVFFPPAIPRPTIGKIPGRAFARAPSIVWALGRLPAAGLFTPDSAL